MNKFIFKNTFKGYDGEEAETTKVFEADNLSEILENFEDFLKGCGFSLKGHLEVVEPEHKTCGFCTEHCGNSWCSTEDKNDKK